MCCESCRKSVSSKVAINKQKFIDGNLYEKALFVHAVNPMGLHKAIERLGLELDHKNAQIELQAFSELAEIGLDKSGELKNNQGKVLNFSFENLISSVPLKGSAMKKAQIKFI